VLTRTSHAIVVINNLDSKIKNINFDCFVMNRYGNYDKIVPYNYLHVDVIDIHGLCIVIVTIGGSLINFHKVICLSPNQHCLFKWVCETCHLAKISKQDNDLFYCNSCKVTNTCVLIGNLKGCIRSLDEPVDVIMKSKWIKAIVDINKEALLKLLHVNHIEII